MKNKLTIIIAAFAILISFAFITKNKDGVKKTNAISNAEQAHTASIDDGYVLEDEAQWD